MNTIKPHGRRGALLPLAAAALVAAAGHADAASRFAVKIADHDGSTLIAGEAARPDTGWIEVHSFGSSLAKQKDGEGNILPFPCEHEGFTFRKRIDKSTPLLQNALVTGLLLPAVQVVYLGPDGSPSPGTEPLTVALHHVQVVSYRMLGGVAGDSLPMEEITLNYSEVEWTYLKTSGHGQVIERSSAILTAFLGTEDPNFDDDNDGVSNDLDADDDNDGISDKDELRGGSNPFRDDADEDLDGDRQTNRDEAIAGTRMDDASDYFGIEKIRHSRTPEGPLTTVSIPVKGGRHYRLLASPDLTVPKDLWMVIDEFDIAAGSPETGADIELSPAILQNAERLFFRADVRLLDPVADPAPVPGEIVPPPAL